MGDGANLAHASATIHGNHAPNQQQQHEQQQKLLCQKVKLLLSQAEPSLHQQVESDGSTADVAATVQRQMRQRWRFLHEQRLVALVLLTRVVDDVFVQRVVEENYQWMMDILVRGSMGSSSVERDFNSCSWGIIRVVGQLWYRSISIRSNTKTTTTTSVLSQPTSTRAIVGCNFVDALATALVAAAFSGGSGNEKDATSAIATDVAAPTSTPAVGPILFQLLSSTRTVCHDDDDAPSATTTPVDQSAVLSMAHTQLELLASVQAWFEYCVEQQVEEREGQPCWLQRRRNVETVLQQLWNALLYNSGSTTTGVSDTTAGTSVVADNTAAAATDAANRVMEQTLTALLDASSHLDPLITAASCNTESDTIAVFLQQYRWQWMQVFASGSRYLASTAATVPADAVVANATTVSNAAEVATTRPTTSNMIACLPRLHCTLLRQWFQQPKLDRLVESNQSSRFTTPVRQWQAETLLAMLLGYSQACQHQRQETCPAVAADEGADGREDDLAHLVVRLILASVVVLDDDDAAAGTTSRTADPASSLSSTQLRTTAWQCTSSLMSTLGCSWAFGQHDANDTNSNGNGNGQTVNPGCALIRLAVGEYRIQLSRMINDPHCHDPRDGNGASSSSSSTLVGIIAACGGIISETVRYLEGLADDMDNQSGMVIGDSNQSQKKDSQVLLQANEILHLRESLEEALNVTVQYVGLSEQRYDKIDYATLHVLGSLLMNFNPFDSIVVSTSSSDHDVWSASGARGNATTEQKAVDPPNSDLATNEHATLQALHRALQIASTMDTVVASNENELSTPLSAMDCLLPSLAATLALADGDSSLCQLLFEYRILGSDLVAFMEAYFKAMRALASVSVTTMPWACQVLEVWASMEASAHRPKASEKERLQEVLIECMQRTLRKVQARRSPEEATILSLVAGAYIALQGDKGQPSMAHMKVLQVVLTSNDS